MSKINLLKYIDSIQTYNKESNLFCLEIITLDNKIKTEYYLDIKEIPIKYSKYAIRTIGIDVIKNSDLKLIKEKYTNIKNPKYFLKLIVKEIKDKKEV